MDIYCPVKDCAEPWDLDSLHEEAEESGRTFREVQRDFQSKGCKALENAFGSQKHNTGNAQRAAVSEAMFDLLGDDVDGVAAMMEDFGF